MLLAPAAALAHSGGTADDGCHYCHTNCDQYGVEADERHCHGGDGGSGVVPVVTCPVGSGEKWRGLGVAPECRCSPYDRADYHYPASVEARIAQRLGGMVSPYDGTRFESLEDSDIEHIVATSEAHDSGLCAASAAERASFARDLDNLTLATPELNQHEKRAKDAAEWLPELNLCWFAETVIAVRREHGLTIDRREAAAPRCRARPVRGWYRVNRRLPTTACPIIDLTAPVAACCRRVYNGRPMPVHPPWVLDIETIVGGAITLLVVLMPVVVRTVSRHRARRRTPAVLLSARGGRPIPAGSAPREPDAA